MKLEPLHIFGALAGGFVLLIILIGSIYKINQWIKKHKEFENKKADEVLPLTQDNFHRGQDRISFGLGSGNYNLVGYQPPIIPERTYSGVSRSRSPSPGSVMSGSDRFRRKYETRKIGRISERLDNISEQSESLLARTNTRESLRTKA